MEPPVIDFHAEMGSVLGEDLVTFSRYNYAAAHSKYT